ncbi:MAG: ribosome-recycling factor [Victivallales bacterium]|jgi:hypothetical protein|nr:ribosome-recycling factor [Victivallales bacterium]
MKNNRFLLVLILFAIGFTAVGAEVNSVPDAETQKRKERGFDPFVWRAFSRLTEEQRQELLKLQNSDSEQFRQKMRSLGETLRREEEANFAELRKSVAAYRSSTDDQERAKLKQKITMAVKERYMQRLKDNKRQLDAMKRRAEFLEKELAKREKNADQIIDMRVQSLLSGEFPKKNGHSFKMTDSSDKVTKK